MISRSKLQRHLASIIIFSMVIIPFNGLWTNQIDCVYAADTSGITILSGLDVSKATSTNSLEPYSEHWFKDFNISADLSHNRALLYSLTISDRSSFDKIPADYDQAEAMQWGMDPGLGIDTLHKHGFDGAGSVIAYIDQPAAMHNQYKTANLHYKNNSTQNSSMHGPAVLSLLVGKDIGTAPKAEVYFYGHEAWRADQTTHAECLYQIIEQNKKLSDKEKIRMVGFSDNIDPSEKNEEAFKTAVKACEDAGIMVWFCGDYASAVFAPESDRNNPENVYPDHWGNFDPNLVYVPAGSRTTAATDNGNKYIFWGSGGLSWTMPYALGVYADALAIDPTLTEEEIRKLIVDTAYKNAKGLRIINPVEFVATVLERVGRTTDAKALRTDYKKSLKYLYAVMDKSKMSSADILSVEKYLQTIKGVAILEVDASKYHSSDALYSALQTDALQRGGTTVGIQLIGTPDTVPAFDVKYKVDMGSDIDDAGSMKTDLFYGNFNNKVSDIDTSFSVYDCFNSDKNVDLTSAWPVARLPLKSGQFEKFFEKYENFAGKTRYSRLPIVNFSNPIFAQATHIDDMSYFLDRAKNEFKILSSDQYRLYANQKGDFPVNNSGLLGGFEEENLKKENKSGIVEFIINSHGQQNNIDKCWYENNKEKRASLVNSDTINTVLSANPYYLDCWTCNNGYGMADNLTTAALNGQCMGMFSATHIISNNGVNCRASLSKMKNSNFYYFYYEYLKGLNDGKTRAAAFANAQSKYAEALIDDSKNGIKADANYQFNLCNLLAYQNFGVIEPRTITGNESGVSPQKDNSKESPSSSYKTINKGKIELKIGKKKTLKKPSKSKTIKWKSNNKKVAKVTKKGKVTAVSAGTAKITAKVGKKKFVWTVTVKAKIKSFGYDSSKFWNNGAMMRYNGELDQEADYYLDGNLLSVIIVNDDGQSSFNFGMLLSDGNHVLTIKKEGYKTFKHVFSWTTPTIKGIFAQDPFIRENTLYAIMNPKLEGLDVSYSIDGISVIPTRSFVNGDGVFVAWFDVSSLGQSEHTLTVFANGFETENKTFVIN